MIMPEFYPLFLYIGALFALGLFFLYLGTRPQRSYYRRPWFVRLMIALHVWCYDDGDTRHCRRCGRPSA